MRTIHKYPIVIDDQFSIAMPSGAEIIQVADQRGAGAMWAIVDTEAPVERRGFAVRGTGHPLRGNEGRHLGTFQQHGGALVWHVFELATAVALQ